jgi:hypothetical protein
MMKGQVKCIALSPCLYSLSDLKMMPNLKEKIKLKKQQKSLRLKKAVRTLKLLKMLLRRKRESLISPCKVLLV